MKKDKKKSLLVLGKEALIEYLKHTEKDAEQFLQTIKERKNEKMEKIFKTWADPTKDIDHAKRSLEAMEDEKLDSLEEIFQEGSQEQKNDNPYEMIQKIQVIIKKISTGGKLSSEEALSAQITLKNLTETALERAKEKMSDASYVTYREMHTPTCPKVSYAVTAGIAEKSYKNATSYFQVFDNKDVYIGDVFFGNKEISAVPCETAIVKKN